MNRLRSATARSGGGWGRKHTADLSGAAAAAVSCACACAFALPTLCHSLWCVAGQQQHHPNTSTAAFSSFRSSSPLLPLHSLTPLAAAHRPLPTTGIEALVKADKRFSPFTESLFSRSSVNGSREQLTAEENAALNATLAAFLRVLTTHYLSPAAFQVLEYCIRRYK